jgi:hypothetical protein
MLKAIVSAPGVALASRIAWRREPGPASFVLVTVNVAAETDDAPQPRRAAMAAAGRILTTLNWPQKGDIGAADPLFQQEPDPQI